MSTYYKNPIRLGFLLLIIVLSVQSVLAVKNAEIRLGDSGIAAQGEDNGRTVNVISLHSFLGRTVTTPLVAIIEDSRIWIEEILIANIRDFVV